LLPGDAPTCFNCGLLFSLLLNSFFFLFLENYGVRKLEAAFAVLIAVMGLSFAWMFGDAQPNREELLMGKFHLVMWFEYHFSM